MSDGTLPPVGALRELVRMLREEGVTAFAHGETRLEIGPLPEGRAEWVPDREEAGEPVPYEEDARLARLALRQSLFSPDLDVPGDDD